MLNYDVVELFVHLYLSTASARSGVRDISRLWWCLRLWLRALTAIISLKFLFSSFSSSKPVINPTAKSHSAAQHPGAQQQKPDARPSAHPNHRAVDGGQYMSSDQPLKVQKKDILGFCVWGRSRRRSGRRCVAATAGVGIVVIAMVAIVAVVVILVSLS